jgi:hypothetical protein
VVTDHYFQERFIYMNVVIDPELRRRAPPLADLGDACDALGNEDFGALSELQVNEKADPIISKAYPLLEWLNKECRDGTGETYSEHDHAV